jgi:exonuclease SbcD
VREILPTALEVTVHERFQPVRDPRRTPAPGAARGPRELFRDYLSGAGRDNDQVAALFDRLHEEVTG